MRKTSRTSARASHHFLTVGLEQAFHHLFDLVDGLIDDRIAANFDALALSHLTGLAIGSHREAQYHPAAGCGKHHVALADRTHRRVNDFHPNVILRESLNGIAHCLNRALDIGLEHDVELGGLATFHARHEIVERLGGFDSAFFVFALTHSVLSHFAGLFFRYRPRRADHRR